jgi:hypothetical protein
MLEPLRKTLILIAILVLSVGILTANATHLDTTTETPPAQKSPAVGAAASAPAASPAMKDLTKPRHLVVFDAEQTRMAVAVRGSLTVWRLDTGMMIARYPFAGGSVTDLTFTSDGHAVAASLSDGSVAAWVVP